YYWEKVGEEATANSGSYQTVSSGNLSLIPITAKSGIYKVYIKGGYRKIRMSNNNSAKALTAVDSWGNVAWTSMEYAFGECENLTTLPAAAPDLSNVTNMSGMFYGASSFNQNISNWDVSGVTNMNSMFAQAKL